MSWIDRQPLIFFVFVALTLGLAPFVPEPHIWQKIKMLLAGQLSKPLDIFDLFLHGAPWALVIVKLVRWNVKPQDDS